MSHRWTPHPLPDGHFCIAEDTCLSEFMRQAGRLDHDQVFLQKIVSHIRPGTVVIDGGAFLGDHSIAYAKVASTVYAFEPYWPSFLGLCANVFLGRHFNVIPLHEALSGSNELVVAFPEMPPNVGAIVPWYHKHGIRASLQYGEAWTVSIDGFATVQLSSEEGPELRLVYERVGLIKLDIEGREYSALRGAVHTIKRDKPILVLEVNAGALEVQRTSAKELVELVESFGYKWQAIKGEIGGPCWDMLAFHPENVYP